MSDFISVTDYVSQLRVVKEQIGDRIHLTKAERDAFVDEVKGVLKEAVDESEVYTLQHERPYFLDTKKWASGPDENKVPYGVVVRIPPSRQGTNLRRSFIIPYSDDLDHESVKKKFIEILAETNSWDKRDPSSIDKRIESKRLTSASRIAAALMMLL